LFLNRGHHSDQLTFVKINLEAEQNFETQKKKFVLHVLDEDDVLSAYCGSTLPGRTTYIFLSIHLMTLHWTCRYSIEKVKARAFPTTLTNAGSRKGY
jgi:hypothetical protein